MTVRQAVGLIVSLLVAVPLGRAAGQGQVVQKCELRPGHQLVNSGVLYLKSANDTKFEDQRQKDLKDAYRVLTQAVMTGGQEKNPAAWYYLARYYAYQKDLGGADSAFTKAQELAPKCKDDIELWRRSLWVPVFNSGIQAWQAGNTDSAIASFRRADQIYTSEPTGFIYLASLLSGATQPDSAVKYFKLAVRYADDPKFAKEKRDAMFNVARVYHGADRLDDAAAAYKEYLATYPSDVQAMAGLAAIDQRQNQREQALALYNSIVQNADSAAALDLFQAGQEIYIAAPTPPDTAAIGERCRAKARNKRPPLTATQIVTRCQAAKADSVREFRTAAWPQFRVVAQALEAGLVKNPNYRDALYLLTSTYFLIADTNKVMATAQRTYALDPMNRSTLRMIAQAWQLRGKGDSALYYLQLGEALPIEVEVSGFTPDDQGVTARGAFRNFHDKASTAVSLLFEFLDSKGAVVATSPQSIPEVNRGQSKPFEIKATGHGIVAWRYKKA